MRWHAREVYASRYLLCIAGIQNKQLFYESIFSPRNGWCTFLWDTHARWIAYTRKYFFKWHPIRRCHDLITTKKVFQQSAKKCANQK